MRLEQKTLGLAAILALAAALWTLNFLWLQRDTRPPVWDMALHQTYALNYLPGSGVGASSIPLPARSGNYPPFVHLMIALCYLILHPGPHVAALANLPATILLFWAVYALGSDLAGAGAARWACLLTALTPYLIWMSRETVLDYWLSAWVAAALVALLKTEGFQSRFRSLLFGFICACGLLTKWFFAGFLFFPMLYVCIRFRVWRDQARLLHMADASILAGIVAGLWYFPNIPNLVRYFIENAQIGAREGEPAVLSFQSFIYYLRLLEGYQLFGVLFAITAVSVAIVWKRRLLNNGGFLLVVLLGGWSVMTLLRTKDPRFTMPLLGPLLIVSGAWIHSWGRSVWACSLRIALVSILCLQAYAANFGLAWLPRQVVLARGYSGNLRWDWNLYLQDYFQILGPPRREDWRQGGILRDVMEDARVRAVKGQLAVIPDLPRFNSRNFDLTARLSGYAIDVAHLQVEPSGLRSFDGFNYAIITEGDQGMPWSTVSSLALNQLVLNAPGTFRLLGLYVLPDGNRARLYFIQRSAPSDARLAEKS